MVLTVSMLSNLAEQNNRNCNFRGYKGPRKLKTNINPHVLGGGGGDPQKFGDAKIFHFTVYIILCYFCILF